MNILVIGQCTLHWGRMEFGNIGNYYIIEPFFRELHKIFPSAKVRTTMQFSERFMREEKVESLPMGLYYGWTGRDLEIAKEELSESESFKNGKPYELKTDYLRAVFESDLVIDFSGDIWGDNADFLGSDRFEVGLLKDLIAMNFGKKVCMLAGSPGPFSNEQTRDLARLVYGKFDLVTNREPISTQQLYELGFDLSKTKDLACPAFLFEPSKNTSIIQGIRDKVARECKRTAPVVGFVLCGWNFEKGPFDRWPRDDSEYEKFAESIRHLTEYLGVNVCLMSHANGFDVPPAPFVLKHGRDYPIAKQLQSVLVANGLGEHVTCIDDVYNTWDTKAIIGCFDMLVSGRIHAAVAALSQSVPTVVIDYGHEPKAHKLIGFTTVAGMSRFVADPSDSNDMKSKIDDCLKNLGSIRIELDKNIPAVKNLARANFDLLSSLM